MGPAVRRILKGCVELGCSPLLGTKLNMCPVDYVAGATACVALQPRCRGRVFHMANPHPFTFDQYFDEVWGTRSCFHLPRSPARTSRSNKFLLCGAFWLCTPIIQSGALLINVFFLSRCCFVYDIGVCQSHLLRGSPVSPLRRPPQLRTYGWAVAPVPYAEWARRLRAATAQGGEGSALFPLLHFVLDDLPAATAGPLLDDSALPPPGAPSPPSLSSWWLVPCQAPRGRKCERTPPVLLGLS